MSSPAPATIAADPDALAWAELRHDMLLRLASVGMRVAEEIAERAVNSPYHPEPRHEPGRAFAAISRAVRLTLTLEAKVAIYLLALRRGEVPPEPVARAPRPPAERRAARDRDDVSECLVDRETLDEDEPLFLPPLRAEGRPRAGVRESGDTSKAGDPPPAPTTVHGPVRAPALVMKGSEEEGAAELHERGRSP